jgi:hypothetical protein
MFIVISILVILDIYAALICLIWRENYSLTSWSDDELMFGLLASELSRETVPDIFHKAVNLGGELYSPFIVIPLSPCLEAFRK